jgi:hypothetical protein
MPDFPWPEAASLVIKELRKARDPAKTPQVTPRRFPKRHFLWQQIAYSRKQQNATGSHLLHGPGKSGQTDFFPQRYRLFSGFTGIPQDSYKGWGRRR